MAIIGYTLLGILVAVLLLLCLPVSLEVRYQTGHTPVALLRWLFLKFDLTKQEKETDQEPSEKKKTKKTKTKAEPAKRKPMEFAQMLEMVVDLLASLKGGAGMLVRNFRLHKIRLYLVVAKDDAAETAITYGKVNVIIYSVYALAQSFLKMNHPQIEIRPDFTAQEELVDFEVGGRLTPIVAIVAALRIGVSFLIKLIGRKNAARKEKAQKSKDAPKIKENQTSEKPETVKQAAK